MEDTNQSPVIRSPGNRSHEGQLSVEPEKVNEYQQYIDRGGELIKNGRYAEAIKHFRNKDAARQAGLSLTPSREMLVDSVASEDVETMANTVAKNSWFLSEGKRINPSGANINGRNISDIPQIEMSNAENLLAQEIALVHMEEFLHGLQYLRGGPIAGMVDDEVDVAAYMVRHGIPLTDTFLRRYDRGVFLTGNECKDDSLSKSPAIRRGVFVNVQRSNGAIESDWQIIGFDTNTGEAIVRNYARQEEKRLAKPDLAALNQEGVYPFKKCSDFVDLFPVLDQCVRLHGGRNVYDADQLKQLINRVRMGTDDLYKIPRSGGLRLKVADLLHLDLSTIDSRPTTPLN